MSKNILTPEQIEKVTQFITTNQTKYNKKTALIQASFDSVQADRSLQPKLSSSTICRYLRLAGLTKASKNGSSPQPQSPSTVIHAAEQTIKAALLDLDAERDKLQLKLKELDDIAAKYRKLI